MNTKDLIEQYVPAGTHLVCYGTQGEPGSLAIWNTAHAELVNIAHTLYHEHHLPLKIITAFDERASTGFFKIMYVFGVPKTHAFLALALTTEKEFPSLTSSIHEASVYERKIQSFFGLVPTDHPEPRTLILQENWPADEHPLRKDFDWKKRPARANTPFAFRKIGGEEGIYELPVGPVHAGIIEPGHFRFHLAGEEILLLEPRMGYSHKGVEKLFEVLPLQDKVHLSEKIAGDSSFSYSLAFCQALEKLAGVEAPGRAKYLRVIFAELERLTNHLSDIGAIMTDTGFNFGGAQGARLRERIMRLCEQLTGSRFLRGVNTIGGIKIDVAPGTVIAAQTEIAEIAKDFKEAMAVAENSSTLLGRLTNTGVLDKQVAQDHGVTGVAGRATGFAMDARVEYPYAAYDSLDIAVATEKSADVYARYLVRVKEVYASLDILQNALANMPTGSTMHSGTPLFAKNSYAVSVVEGWRGDIVCLVGTDSTGAVARVDLRDPSFLNWDAVGYAGKGNMLPDFPLINKSFSLSYTGHDM